MKVREPSFTLGIEEEYLIVDPVSGDLVAEPPQSLFDACTERIGPHVTNEYLQSQIEVGTSVCTSLVEARSELAGLRRTVCEVAGQHGLAPIAASTHPFASWHSQRHTAKQRYDDLQRDLQAVADRLLICGMHVHVAIEDEDLRVDVFNQISYFLPHLLALSTSSPYWQGLDTGLKSYRLSVFDGLPRTGLPETFLSFAEYQRTVDVLTGAGLMDDATKIWWDLRLSARFPTIEMRVTDVCTDFEDALTIAALFRCIARMLYRLRTTNQRWRSYSRFLINENRWRAQRYGGDEGLVDLGRGEIVDYPELMEELIELTAEDAEFFGCLDEVERVRLIAARGTSSDRQRKAFEAARTRGSDVDEALREVVRSLVAETAAGCEAAVQTE
ncbi:MAG: carboxylate-amine ligase [Rhizobiales bacterium]|nr:carboxylate-amine ligase [Hyphomicrobiales bacterium]